MMTLLAAPAFESGVTLCWAKCASAAAMNCGVGVEPQPRPPTAEALKEGSVGTARAEEPKASTAAARKLESILNGGEGEKAD